MDLESMSEFSGFVIKSKELFHKAWSESRWNFLLSVFAAGIFIVIMVIQKSYFSLPAVIPLLYLALKDVAEGEVCMKGLLIAWILLAVPRIPFMSSFAMATSYGPWWMKISNIFTTSWAAPILFPVAVYALALVVSYLLDVLSAFFERDMFIGGGDLFFVSLFATMQTGLALCSSIVFGFLLSGTIGFFAKEHGVRAIPSLFFAFSVFCFDFGLA